MHGDLGQGAREKALKAFRTGEVDVLVATDVAARGIDIDDITHVINYQIPEDEQAYVHRIGRTGRAGKTGIAVTLVDWDELPRWTMIDKALGLNTPDPAETYSSSPHLYEELNIPADATGTIGGPRKTQAKRPPAEKSADRPARNRDRTRRRTRGGEPATGTLRQRRRPTGRTDAEASADGAPQAQASPSPAQGRGQRAAKPDGRRAQPDGQTRTPHPGRRGGGHRRSPWSSPSRPRLVWWTSDARATISRPAADAVPTVGHRQGGALVAAAVVDRAQPEDHDAAGGRRQRGHR